MMANLHNIMKTKWIFLAATMIASVTQARPVCDSALLRQADALERMADDIAYSHRRSLGGRCASQADQRFLSNVQALQVVSARFLGQVRSGDDKECLINTLSHFRRTFGAVRDQAHCMRISSNTKELLCNYWNVLDSINLHRAFAERERHYDSGRDHDHYREPTHRESVSDRELVIGAIGRLLGGR